MCDTIRRNDDQRTGQGDDRRKEYSARTTLMDLALVFLKEPENRAHRNLSLMPLYVRVVSSSVARTLLLLGQ